MSSSGDEVLAGGGEMGALMRSMDWSTTPLGSVASWPQSLRTTVSLCLGSTFPILIAWGPERVQIYNDSYRPICGAKHPQSMGQRFNDCWESALPAVGSVVQRAQDGEGSYIENLRMFLDRNGYMEEAFMTFSFSPIRDETGKVGGLFHPITEVTDKMLTARRVQGLRDLAVQLGKAKTLAQVWEVAAGAFGELELDLPFLLFYQLDESGKEAHLRGAVGLAAGTAAAPALLQLDANGESTWPLGTIIRTGQIEQVDDLAARLGPLRCGPYPESPRTALLIPIHVPGVTAPVACLVAGVSARRALDALYRAFYESLAATITTAVVTVRAHEQELEHLANLAAVDRSKTAFLGNVSHEFRTPLTLMLGPTEDALASPEGALRGSELLMVHRNELRLLKLVNTLLDFSRIEAGRVQASYEPTDLSLFTTDLASIFRSTVERAGLRLVVECPPLPEDVWVDREMWEKIVLNLLSNAFKFTFAGSIQVQLQWLGTHVELAIADTGTGIAETEVPRLFERFYRVQGANGRSYEGSGIGLALVQEMVRLQGGDVRVTSRAGEGSTFFVSLPAGNAHLPREQVHATRTAPSAGSWSAPFIHEALQWVEAPPTARAETFIGAQVDLSIAAPARSESTAREGRILLADDNADMRVYVRRLLEGRYTVDVVADGVAALEAARTQVPDLILADVMMPGLDGFELLRGLKNEPRTAAIPVVLLSARAGVESTLEGLAAGARDYLVKPFSGRELVARVDGAFRVARERARITEILESVSDAFFAVDKDWRIVFVNSNQERVSSTPRSESLGRIFWEVFPAATRVTSKYWIEYHRCMEDRVPVSFVEYYAPLNVWTDVRAHPTPEGGIAVFFRDVSEEKKAGEALRLQAEFEQQLVGIVSHDLRNPLNAIQLSAELLTQFQGKDDRATKEVLRIKSSVGRATRLVGDLLDFTQARLGRGIPVRRTKLDSHDVFRSALQDVRSAFPDRELHFSAEGSGEGEWDGDRLIQIIENLATNALKYSPPGTSVRVSVRGDPDAIVLSVHNDGPPIAAHFLPELFEPMRLGTKESGREPGSIGLGLYIVDQLARAHEGSVSVSSSHEDGTTFRVRLPRIAQAGEASALRRPNPRSPPLLV